MYETSLIHNKLTGDVGRKTTFSVIISKNLWSRHSSPFISKRCLRDKLSPNSSVRLLCMKQF